MLEDEHLVMFFPENTSEKLQNKMTKNLQRQIFKTHVKSQKTLEHKMDSSCKIFSFDIPLK